ncbi:hypothetical protein GCM10011415_04570 [Salipiger pallidus]|uniref:Uncharacterized protein n=1 Tax=Salipiger pallidus TaxID=1775170 RepID=A0A8J2ZGJ9_9RHOB|nr:hypothetical protein [Salipiger pallidus]GGG61527.1 hypothetical protein GCM10011415_04570 [Salipiger pallidus]
MKYSASFFAERSDGFSEIERCASSGRLLWLHVYPRIAEDDLDRTIVDIFRAGGGIIVELLEGMQPVPAKAINDNTMF